MLVPGEFDFTKDACIQACLEKEMLKKTEAWMSYACGLEFKVKRRKGRKWEMIEDSKINKSWPRDTEDP